MAFKLSLHFLTTEFTEKPQSSLSLNQITRAGKLRWQRACLFVGFKYTRLSASSIKTCNNFPSVFSVLPPWTLWLNELLIN